MDDQRPSRTAAAVAMRRASHQLLDRPVVFADPLALPILGDDLRARLDTESPEGLRGFAARQLRAFLAARSRTAEDTLADFVARGLRQYVVLGAGLDTFAYRNPWPELHVFEVDHPATQGWKRRRLRDAGLAVPGNARLVAVDFARDDPAARLADAGLDASAPVFFSWLGVTPYLERGAIQTTLRWVAAASRHGGGIVFDYIVDGSQLTWFERLGVWLVARRVTRAGEPFRTFFMPDALDRELRDAGFRRVEDLEAAAINARFFAGRNDGLRVGNSGRIVIATHPLV